MYESIASTTCHGRVYIKDDYKIPRFDKTFGEIIVLVKCDREDTPRIYRTLIKDYSRIVIDTEMDHTCKGIKEDTETEKTKLADDENFEWKWEKSEDESKYKLSKDDTLVTFSPEQISMGTAGVKGKQPLARAKHHYWEIQLPAEFDIFCGSHTGIGIVTNEADLNARSGAYSDLLGIDAFSWGLSLTTGRIRHEGRSVNFCRKKFASGDRIGVHLDRWNGTIEFYCNHKLLGAAFKEDPETKKKLQTCELYPAAYSSSCYFQMELTFAKSYVPSLELHSLQVLCRMVQVSKSTSLYELVRRCCRKANVPNNMDARIRGLYWWLAVVSHQGDVSMRRETPMQNFELTTLESSRQFDFNDAFCSWLSQDQI